MNNKRIEITTFAALMKYAIFALTMLLAGCAGAQHGLRRGDLLFHVVSQGNHITDVTPGQTDHVAIYAGNGLVLEAIPRAGVVTTLLDTVLQREAGHYVRGRVRGVDVAQSLSNARQYLGLPYDSLFLPTAEAIYCSELVQLAYVDKHGRRLFHAIPMSFHDETGRITPYWQQFYEQRGLSVPEGEPGTNPGELSQRKAVVIKKLK